MFQVTMSEESHTTTEDNIYSDGPISGSQSASGCIIQNSSERRNEPVRIQIEGSIKITRRKCVMGIVAVAAVIFAAVFIVVLAVSLVKTTYQVEDLESQLKSCQVNATSNMSDNVVMGSSISSCSMLPKSSPSGFYRIVSSNGSTIRVYCDMKKTCGNITGGWMRVASLDMRQPSSMCPSSLCLFASRKYPRTCRRCYNSQIYSVPTESYHVGVPYTHVCGRIKAYQVGTTDGYFNWDTHTVEGISLSYESPEIFIWVFFADLQEKYHHSRHACPCMNPDDSSIAPPPKFIGNHYFCDTGAVMAQRGKFYEENPLWDGYGCKGDNKCCLFNHPPWFYRKLLARTEEPIIMKVRLDEGPMNEDVAIELIHIYVQ